MKSPNRFLGVQQGLARPGSKGRARSPRAPLIVGPKAPPPWVCADCSAISPYLGLQVVGRATSSRAPQLAWTLINSDKSRVDREQAASSTVPVAKLVRAWMEKIHELTLVATQNVLECAGRAKRRRRFGPCQALLSSAVAPHSGVARRLPPQSKTWRQPGTSSSPHPRAFALTRSSVRISLNDC